MSRFKSDKKSCRDVFNAFLVRSAIYSGIFEFPIIQPTYWIPNKLIAFSKAISCKDCNQWVHFYEYDYLFERIWRNPRRYLPILKRYNGVILPDFSLYRDMPLAMQLWNIYRSRALGFWLQGNGIKIIANVRWGDWRTYRFCCDALAKQCTIAIGSDGAIENTNDRHWFTEGLEAVVRRLRPRNIVVYGSAPADIFDKYRAAGIGIVQFDCDTTKAHRGVK